jgi:hypothetical protein
MLAGDLLARLSGPIDRQTALSSNSPLPRASGLYVWLFREAPPPVSTETCIEWQAAKLLYIGISPNKLSKPQSTQSLRSRIQYHYRGNAEGSTLRRTLGILLTEDSGYPLRRVGSGKRMTLTHDGERWLNRWLEANALVAWLEDEEPWRLEEKFLGEMSCPLNLDKNRNHPFHPRLKAMRSDAILRARALPIAEERLGTRNIQGSG